MRACWNCGTAQEEDAPFCGHCGRAASPGPEMLVAVDYLVTEVDSWEWLNAWRRGEITGEYRARRARLERVLAGESLTVAAATITAERAEAALPAFGGAAGQPPSAADWMAPPPQPVASQEWIQQLVAAPPPPVPAGPALLERVSAFMEERNIRWIHTLGALLLLAAGIGFLRAQWSLIGTLVVTVALLLAPIASFAAAFRMRTTLPISSRLLSALGGLLMPTGLLALRVFGFVQAPAEPWDAMCFGVCAGALAWLCVALEEPACVYLGAASAALSAHYVAAAANHPPLFGMLLLPLAFGLLLGSRAGKVRAALDEHVRYTAHIVAAVGLLATEASAGVLPRFGDLPPHPAFGPLQVTVCVAVAGVLFYALSAATFGLPAHLYASCACAVYGASAAGFWLAPHELVFFQLGAALVMALAALAVERGMPRAWARPLAQVAGVVTVAALARETADWADGSGTHLGSALLVTSLVCGAMARAWREWPALDRTVEDGLALASSTLLPAALLVLLPPDARLATVALVLIAAYGIGRVLPNAWRTATRLSALLWMPALIGLPHASNLHLALLEVALPAGFYATLCLLERRPALGAISFVLVLPVLDPGTPPLSRALVLTLFTTAYAAMYRLDKRFSVAAWLVGLFAWGSVLRPLDLEGAALALAWWPVTIGLGALRVWRRDPLIGRLAGVTVAGVAACALDLSPTLALPLTLGVHALLAAFAALIIDRGEGRPAALELLGAAAVLTALLLGMQPYLWQEACFVRMAASLAIVAAAAAAFEPRFRDWPVGRVTGGDVFAHLATLCLPFLALAVGRAAGFEEALPVPVIVTAALLLGAGMRPGSAHWRTAAHHATLLGTVLAAVVPSNLPGLPLIPAVLWAAASLSGQATRNAVELAAALVLAHAAFVRPAVPAVQVLVSFSAALAATAVKRGAESDATASLVLLPAGLALCAAREIMPWPDAALGTALLALGAATVRAVLPDTNVFARPLAHLGPLFAVAAGALGTALGKPGVDPASGAVVAAACALAVSARTRGAEWPSHAAYALLHLLLLTNVPEPRALEWYAVPLGLWLLWVASRRQDARLEMTASLLIGVPWLWTSLVDPSPAQAVTAGIVGVALFLLGVGRRRLQPAVIGTAVVVAEIALQTHRFLVSMPWQVYALVAGLGLMTLGVLFERKRQRFLALGARILADWQH